VRGAISIAAITREWRDDLATLIQAPPRPKAPSMTDPHIPPGSVRSERPRRLDAYSVPTSTPHRAASSSISSRYGTSIPFLCQPTGTRALPDGATARSARPLSTPRDARQAYEQLVGVRNLPRAAFRALGRWPVPESSTDPLDRVASSRCLRAPRCGSATRTGLGCRSAPSRG